MSENTKRIYLDHSATTPIDLGVLSAMKDATETFFGNPSSIHKEGVVAKKVMTDARNEIAESLGAHGDEIIFTGSGTEANNLAIFGVIQNPKNAHVIISNIEHPSVFECVKELERRGAEVTLIPVEPNGIVDPKKIGEALQENTVLVSVMYANNEIGTIQPIKEIAKILRLTPKTYILKPLLHTDACQATNYLDMNVLRLGIDLMTFNASKIYGPKGIGALYVKRGVELSPLIFGGGQEKGIRSGTENVASVVGFARAMKITETMKETEVARLTELRNYFISEVEKKIPGAILNGDTANRLPNNVNFSFPGSDGEEIVITLDARGIACSTGSACANIAHDGKVSPVLLALGQNIETAKGGVRFTLGRETIKEDIDFTVASLREIIAS